MTATTAYNDLYIALSQGLTAAENLLGYVLEHKPYAAEITEDRIKAIRRGIAALDELDELRTQSKPCARTHLDLDAEPVDGCLCHVSKNPPCTWCENGGGDPEASATQPMPTFAPGELDGIRADDDLYLAEDPVAAVDEPKPRQWRDCEGDIWTEQQRATQSVLVYVDAFGDVLRRTFDQVEYEFGPLVEVAPQTNAEVPGFASWLADANAAAEQDVAARLDTGAELAAFKQRTAEADKPMPAHAVGDIVLDDDLQHTGFCECAWAITDPDPDFVARELDRHIANPDGLPSWEDLAVSWVEDDITGEDFITVVDSRVTPGRPVLEMPPCDALALAIDLTAQARDALMGGE